MAECTMPSPLAELACGRPEHPAAIAHHARGTSMDGIEWAVYWWDPEQVAAAERPPFRFGVPTPRSSSD
jgi:hypothetical protein